MTRVADVLQWTVRLDARTSAGEVKTTELVTFSRPAVVSTLAEIGLMLVETKTILAKLQASMLCGQKAEYAPITGFVRLAGFRSRSRTVARGGCRRCSAR